MKVAVIIMLSLNIFLINNIHGILTFNRNHTHKKQSAAFRTIVGSRSNERIHPQRTGRSNSWQSPIISNSSTQELEPIWEGQQAREQNKPIAESVTAKEIEELKDADPELYFNVFLNIPTIPTEPAVTQRESPTQTKTHTIIQQRIKNSRSATVISPSTKHSLPFPKKKPSKKIPLLFIIPEN